MLMEGNMFVVGTSMTVNTELDTANISKADTLPASYAI